MATLPKKPLSQQPRLTTLPSGTVFPVLLTPQAEPDRTKRNPTATVEAVAAVLGLNRGPNLHPSGNAFVRAVSTTSPNYGPGSTTRDGLNPNFLCLGMICRSEFADDGTPGGQLDILVSDYAPRTAPGLEVWNDGDFTYRLPARWVPVDSPEAQVQNYAAYPVGYAFPAATYVAAYVTGQSTEQFFKRRAPGGPAPAPTAGGDATYWELVSAADVPVGGGSGTGGGFIAWAAGVATPKGQGLFNSLGIEFYAKEAIANPQAQPFLPTSSAQANALYKKVRSDLDAALLALPWQYIGDLNDGNVSLGFFAPSNSLGAGSRANQIDYNARNLTLGTDCLANVVGAYAFNVALGSNSNTNVIGAFGSSLQFGAACSGNVLGSDCSNITMADNCEGNRLEQVVFNVSFGANCDQNFVGVGVTNTVFGAGCQRVRVEGVQPNGTTLTIPAGTTDAVYRNGVRVFPILVNEHGTHPALASQHELNVYLLSGGTYTPPTPAESVTITNVQAS